MPNIRHGNFKVVSHDGRYRFTVNVVTADKLSYVGGIDCGNSQRWGETFIYHLLNVLRAIDLPNRLERLKLLYPAAEREMVQQTLDSLLVWKLSGRTPTVHPPGYRELIRAIQTKKGLRDDGDDADYEYA